MSKQEAIYAGIGAGLLFGLTQAFSFGIVAGLTNGAFFGVAMGLVMYWFVDSKLVKKQTALPESILLPGERALESRLANLVIRPRDFGLDDFMFDGLLWVVGMKKKESLGGMLHLTNYRLVFITHRYNRLRGMTSVFLPTVRRLEDHTALKIFRRLAVTTGSARIEFVVADVAKVIAQIDEAREDWGPDALAELQNHVRNHPAQCSDELAPWTAFNKINRLFSLGKRATTATQVVTNPLGALSSKLIGELLDKTVIEKWQRIFHASEQDNAA